MANPLNVYRGPDSVRSYFDPDSSPPLPLVEIPDCLNPYRRHGVRIYAKMMSMHPTNNVKSMPALNLLEKTVEPGSTKTIVEYSSGSTVISMAMVARVFHELDDVRAYLSNKTSMAKIRLMQFFGLDVTLFGGPSQPEPEDERGGIKAAERIAHTSPSVINPNQYDNDNNWKAHVRWTGPQILKQLPEINLICAGMGTSGTMTGLGTYMKATKPSVYRLGVCTAPGDRVPGPRSHALLAPVEFPWRKAVDSIEEVGSYDSFSLSLELCRHGLVCGPSSGFNLQGLFNFIEARKAAGTLSDLATGDSGEIHCVFLCCDLPYQYITEYFDKLGDSHFPPIHNEHLTKVDLYRYDDAWEVDAVTALRSYFNLATALPTAETTVIDLRQPQDFSALHLPGSTSVPFVHPDTPSPFTEPKALGALWTRLEETFQSPTDELRSLMHSRRNLLLVCYDGDSARVATSVLRAKGFEACSIRGGFKSWAGRSPVAMINAIKEEQNNTAAAEAAAAQTDPIIVAPQVNMDLPSSEAAPLLTSFTSFLTISIHTILYHRHIYPPETFLTARAYNTLAVRQSRHPGVCAWISDAVSAVATQLRDGSVDRVVLAIHSPKEGFRVLERWVFDVSRFPSEWGAAAVDDQGGGEAGPSAATAAAAAAATATARDDGEAAREGEREVINWTDVNESMRGAVGRVAYAAEKMGPNLPSACTFTLAVELRDEAPAPIKHPQEWIPSEPHMQPGRDPESATAAATTVPVRSVRAGPLFFECWAERSRLVNLAGSN
ncbi:Cysteine synthase [Geosmithia morbida]|uniref:Cysteine synthase n=1 Tax=Geosmithia morbida TaxID=1094350 RepID=A0A9P4Z2G8_9HYPO|nr:Cysteine synthase [Geosmithia morbida]KAF4126490.1 Cysteine synthase [Geosmithia morbida]